MQTLSPRHPAPHARRVRTLLVLAAAVSFAALVPATPLAAQSPYDYTLAVSAGIGGFLDATPDSGFDDPAVQALFAMRLEPSTYFGVRLGQLDLQVDEEDGGPLFDASLTYATLAGEYRFNDGWYRSGLYLGLGAYDLGGDFAIDDESGFGLSAGVNGDFRLTDRFSLLVELSGHWADLDHAQTFITGTAGIAFHF